MPTSPLLAKPRSRFLSRTLDWIFPAICVDCDEPLSEGRHLCPSCSDKLQPLPANSCERCASIYDGEVQNLKTCPSCNAVRPKFDFATSALRGTEESLALIHRFKLLKQRYLASDLARVAAPAFRKDARLSKLSNPLLVPVPLHPARERQRGFNQSLELTRELSRLLAIPYLEVLKRRRKTPRQALLTQKERLKNLKSAFALRGRPSLEDNSLILIDDVLTTGATADACARVLKTTKPTKIAVFTIVRA